MHLRSVSVFFLIFAINALAEGPVFKQEKTRLSRPVGSHFSYELKNLLKSYETLSPINWRMSRSLPDWVEFEEGRISGRMPNEHYAKTFRVEARNGGKVALADLEITADRPAKWLNAQLDLGKIAVDRPFSYDLNQQIWNDDRVTAQIQVRNLPGWMKYDRETGILSGQPTAANQGAFRGIQFALSGSSTPLSAFGEVSPGGRVPVISPREIGETSTVSAARPGSGSGSGSVARGPFTLDSEVLKLSNLMFGKPFDYDLNDNVKYTGTGKVNYSFGKPGPGWFKLDPSGKITGTPDVAGNFIAVVLIADATTTVELILDVSVADDDQAPIINQSGLSFNVAEREDKTFDLTPFVSQSGSKPLTYRLTAVYGWATLSADGKKLRLAPQFAQVGAGTLGLEVSNGVNRANAKIVVTVGANPQTPVWDSLVRVSGKVGSDLSGDISRSAKDLDGRRIVFSKQGGSRWFGVTAEGKVFGRVEEPTGEQTFTVRASNGTLSADKDIVVSVTRDNRPPFWNLPEITLKNARALEDYTATVNDPKFVADPDGDPIVFSWVSGLKWAGVQPDGTIIGKPSKGQVGPGSLLVKATDSKGLSSQITVNIQVDPPNGPPRWTAKQPILLGEIPIGKALAVDLLTQVEDPENDALTFRKVSGPSWLTVDPMGSIGGAPLAGEKLGPFNAKISASDTKSEIEAAFIGSVVPPNHAPEIDPKGLAYLIEERRTYTVDLKEFVTDFDGDKLLFSLDDRSSFVELSGEGILSIRASFSDIGAKPVKFTVTDRKDPVSATIAFTVVRVPRPPRWKDQRITINAPAGVPFTGSLTGYVEDLDKLPLSFSRNLKFGPSWLSVDSDGKMSGTPTDAHVGENNFIVVATNDKLSANGALTINITSDNNPPRWKPPVTLKAGKAGDTYFQSLASDDYVVDPDDGDFLTFTILTDPTTGKPLAPEWAELTKQGLVYGSPFENHVGPNSLMIRATDSRGAFADARVSVPIVSRNNAPEWSSPVLLLGTIKVGEEFTYDLNRFVDDKDKDRLEFKKLEGPERMNVSTDGLVKWTPLATDVGAFVGVFQVNDTKAFVPVDFSGSVGTAAKPPLIHTEKLAFSVVPGQEFNLNLADPIYVENPDGGTLAFKLLSSLPWVQLQSNGSLKLTPPSSQKGKATITFLVVNTGGGSAQGDITITLDATIEAPRWIQDVEYTAQAGSTFTGDLNDFAKDLKKLPLTFKKVSGPAWLTVNADGKITGRPTLDMVREPQTFVVNADNSFKNTEAPMVITVLSTAVGPGPGRGSNSDVYPLKVVRAGMAVDLLFLLDHTARNTSYYQDMKRGSEAFFTKLDRAQVRYSVAVLSSHEFLGEPRTEGSGSIRITSGNTYASSDFNKRVDGTFSAESSHSLVWALDRFFVGLTQQKDYRNDFYLETIPVLVMAHAFSADDYRALSRVVDPARVGRGFQNFHATLHKPFQLYIKDNSCQVASAKDYRELAASAGGTAIVNTPCRPPFEDWMSHFADLAIEQAARFNVRKINLSSRPTQASDVKVSLRNASKSTPLTGNTGADSDQWKYDPASNTVFLQWWNIRLPSSKDDEIVVEY